MAERSKHLVERVFPEDDVRHWVLSVPVDLRRRLAFDHVDGVYLERFGSAQNLNARFSSLWMDGCFVERSDSRLME